MGDNLCVGIRFENLSLGLHGQLQFSIVFNNAVVHKRDGAIAVRVRIGDRRCAVGGPARVANPDRAAQGFGVNNGFQVLNLTGGPAALRAVVGLHSDARRVVATIFKATQGFQQARGDGLVSNNTDNTAHDECP